ncbi:MAG: c-type cytochrome domain-containing protein [Candidatus Hydrogenedentales bacterium]|jgi:uncharacterized membrane protein/mono/diheme cytochrome c family protein
MGFFDTFSSPAVVHALAVHTPIALAFFGVPLVILAAVLVERGAGIRWLAVAAYLGLAVAAFVTVHTGEGARNALPNAPGLIDEPVWNLVRNHQSMAGKVWLFALATALLTACTAAQSPRMRLTMGTLAVVSACATAVWLGLTGHYGGTLVYVHGLGTPALHYKQQLIARDETPSAARPSGPAAPGFTETVPASGAPESAGPAAAILPPGVVETESAIPAPVVRDVSYAQEVMPILREHCYSCHGKASGLSLETIDAMLVGGRKAGPAVRAGQPEKSPLILYVTGELQPRMPEGGEALSENDITILRNWIARGMKDDSPG